MIGLDHKRLAAGAGPTLRIGPTALGLLTFAAGATAILKTEIIGEIYVAEMVLPLLAIPALFSRRARPVLRDPTFRVLIGALFVTLLGYAFSDLFRGSAPDQYLRGWGRIVLVGTDFAALALLVAADRRNLWWFAAGIGAGGVLYLRLQLHMPLPMWKFGYAGPMTIGAAAFAYFLPRRVAALMFVALGFLGMKYDFRIHSAVCLFVAAVLWLRAGERGRVKVDARKYWKLILAGSVAVLLLVTFKQAMEDDWHVARRDQSTTNRVAGLVAGIRIVAGSPIIGYGSWSSHEELFEVEQETAREMLGRGTIYERSRGSALVSHSQLLQSWIEGGILGAGFFLVLGYQFLRRGRQLILERPLDALMPILLYFYAFGLWDLFMSPFAATSRLAIAAAATVFVTLSLEHTDKVALRKALAIRQRSRQPIPDVQHPAHPGRPGWRRPTAGRGTR